MRDDDGPGIQADDIVRRANALRLEFADANIRLTNFLTRRSALLTPAAVGYLASLNTPTPYSEAVERIPSDGARARVLMDSLLDATIVLKVGGSDEISDRNWAACWGFGHDTAAFHFSVRPRNIGDRPGGAADSHRAEYHCGTHHCGTPLPRSATDNGITATMNKRRSACRFTSRAVTLDALARVLFSMAGVTGQADDPVFGQHPLSFSPSAGALNPYELYVIPGKVPEIPPATYRYDSNDQSLLRIGPYPDNATALAGDQQWASDAAFMTVLVAVLGRSWVKYPSPAGYANVLIEAGHRAQNALLTAADLDLSARMTTAVNDDIARHALELSGCEQAPIYLLAFGYG
jgi:SagB-type dehydrogenase family enzyme